MCCSGSRRRDFVAFQHERIERDPFANGVATTPGQHIAGRVLTDEQSRALEALVRRRRQDGFPCLCCRA